MACLVRMLWCCVEGIIGSLTRFALIMHMFHGEGLCSVSRITYGLLQRYLPGVIATGFVSEMLFLVRRPLLTIVLIFQLHSAFEIVEDHLNAFSVAALSASTVAVVFNYFASIVEYSTDTIFYCYALEAEGEARQVRLKPLYDVMEKQVEVE